MITEIRLNQLDEMLAFAWKLQSCLDSASYPMYASEQDLGNAMLKHLRHDDDKLLACHNGDTLAGVINLLVEKDNRYLQTGGIYAGMPQSYVYQELLAYAADRYSGFELDFGFPLENAAAVNIMRDIGAKRIESSIALSVTPDDFAAYPTGIEVQELNAASFDEFARLHDTACPDVYWTSARINEDLTRWRIFVIRDNGGITGFIQYGIWGGDEAEIYAAAAKPACTASFTALLANTLPVVFALNKQSVLYMVDDTAISELEAALRCGFQKKGHYLCYRLIL